MAPESDERGTPGGGYPFGLSYMKTLQPVTDPAELALVALTQQRHPPDTTRPFRYAEFGCGHGVNLAALAACWPAAQFDGVDYLPEHVASGRALARDAGLTNLNFSESDFAALSGLEPAGGRYDFVALHGVWSWVSDENRAHLLALLDRWVAPGGSSMSATMPTHSGTPPIRCAVSCTRCWDPGPARPRLSGRGTRWSIG